MYESPLADGRVTVETSSSPYFPLLPRGGIAVGVIPVLAAVALAFDDMPTYIIIRMCISR
jgi:hypothetical protein